MRVAIVYFQSTSRDIKKLADAYAKGIMEQNHVVQLVNGETDSDVKLTSFDYILIGTGSLGFLTSKISTKISSFIGNCGFLSGKKSYAFIAKKGLFSSKSLTQLMKVMEKEGLVIKNSHVLSSTEEAEYLGKRLHIKK